MKRFDLEIETTESIDDLRREFLTSWTGELAACGFSLTSQSDVGVTFSRRYRRWYVIVLAILLFPIGLLFLLVTDEATITAAVEPDDDTGGSVLIVRGKASKEIRDGFERMRLAHSGSTDTA